MIDTFRWGILGTGNIARQFARDLAGLPGHEIGIVASRDGERAGAFCREFGGVPVVGYEAMLGDAALDAVYLSLPNALHAQWTMAALEAGHHVLCEKPLAMNVAEAREMFDAARRSGRTLIEAFMYRCHPQTTAVVKAVREGAIGRLTHIRTSFVFRIRSMAGNIRFDAALGGGALMDVGCYCISFSNLMAGAGARDVQAISRRHESGVDIMTSGLIGYENGVQATFTCGMDAQADNAATICGSEGYITIDWPWKPTNQAAGFTISRGIPPRQDLKAGQAPTAPPAEFVATPAELPLFALEARAFAKACRGEAEAFMPEAETLATLEVMERVRESQRPG